MDNKPTMYGSNFKYTHYQVLSKHSQLRSNHKNDLSKNITSKCFFPGQTGFNPLYSSTRCSQKVIIFTVSNNIRNLNTSSRQTMLHYGLFYHYLLYLVTYTDFFFSFLRITFSPGAAELSETLSGSHSDSASCLIAWTFILCVICTNLSNGL